ncbi:MAG: glutamine--fructose-6-phosphate transaminase (isomerizing), partial [Oscillospiraceae bacterium]|nr:glutamine--fructose-6-phosphate transaminase (isomerizing) [Oscillospiraceae bacterium]
NDGRFAVVHNGIIENYLSLREELIADGYVFESETDTEVIVHLVEMYYAGSVRDALIRTVNRLRGSYALGVICSEEPGKIYAVREASPLIIGVGAGENYFASDVTALVNYTRSVIYLEDGEFAELSEGSIRIFDCTGQELRKKVSRILWDVQAAEKGGYEHFMLKEIMEQPGAVKATIAPRLSGGKVDFEELAAMTDGELRAISKIVVTACGSAYYAGCAGRYAFERLCGLPVQLELASELRYSDPLIDGTTLVVVISQSGETADTIAALKEAKSRGAKTLAVVNVVGSTVAKLADYTVYTWAGPEIAVATTKGYTTQTATLNMLAVYFAARLGRIEDQSKYVAALQALPRRIQQAIDLNPAIPALAKKYHDNRALFFIGRNTDYAVALEGALKMKEISYIHAESYAAGELKHGTIALIEERTPVVALCCNPSVTEKTISNIVEVKSRGAEVLALTFRTNRKMLSVADDLLFIPEVDALFSAAVEIVPLQLLAYYVAKENGCDIDKPKNLAKSVTVE